MLGLATSQRPPWAHQQSKSQTLQTKETDPTRHQNMKTFWRSSATNSMNVTIHIPGQAFLLQYQKRVVLNEKRPSLARSMYTFVTFLLHVRTILGTEKYNGTNSTNGIATI